MRKIYLYSLYLELQRNGVLQRAIRYKASADFFRLTIYYYDEMLRENYMSICRSSRLCYYLFVGDEKKTFRTQKQILKYLDDFFTANGEWMDYVNYIKSSKMLENRFYHSRIEYRNRDFENWKAQRKKELDKTFGGESN